MEEAIRELIDNIEPEPEVTKILANESLARFLKQAHHQEFLKSLPAKVVINDSSPVINGNKMNAVDRLKGWWAYEVDEAYGAQSYMFYDPD